MENVSKMFNISLLFLGEKKKFEDEIKLNCLILVNFKSPTGSIKYVLLLIKSILFQGSVKCNYLI